MATKTGDGESQATSGLSESLDRLKDEARSGLLALTHKAIGSVGERLTGATERLNQAASGSGPLGQAAAEAAEKASEEVATGGSPAKGAVKGGLKGMVSGAKDKVTGALGGGGGGGGDGVTDATKSTNIIESIDIGVPVSVVYNQWTQFQDFPSFMKKVENVEQESDEKLSWKAQIFWSHRTWESTIIDQVPDQHIVWRSQGEKGHVDGAVTFHELAPRLTRVILVLEYYPQGFFEKVGNIWRAPGRRARLEFKHFRRHVMMNVLLDPDSVQGWRGEIHDEEVTRSHDEVVEEESHRREEAAGGEDEDEAAEGDYEDDYDDEAAEYEDEAAEDEDEAAEDEDEYTDADDETEPLDDEYEEDEVEDEYEDDDEHEESAARRRSRSRAR